MIKIVFNKCDKTNWLEATWIEETISLQTVQVEKEIDNEIVFIDEEKEVINQKTLKCHSYADCQMDLLRADNEFFNVQFSEEQLKIINDLESNVKPLSDEQLKEIEDNRILCIKSKCKELIESKYPIYKQMNIIMSGISADIVAMNSYISKIRDISNKAEKTTLNYDEVDWKI